MKFLLLLSVLFSVNAFAAGTYPPAPTPSPTPCPHNPVQIDIYPHEWTSVGEISTYNDIFQGLYNYRITHISVSALSSPDHPGSIGGYVDGFTFSTFGVGESLSEYVLFDQSMMGAPLWAQPNGKLTLNASTIYIEHISVWLE